MSPTATLPEYQQYLLSRKLVPEKNVSYYAHWVSLYLAFSNRQENMDKVDMLQRFLDDLQSRKHMDDWQVQQAREAVQLYMGQFLTNPSYPLGSTRDDTLTPTLSLKGEGDEVGSTSSGAFDPDSVLARMREAIRLHLNDVKALHDRDLAAGFGEVYLPDALARKYPNAAKDMDLAVCFPLGEALCRSPKQEGQTAPPE